MAGVQLSGLASGMDTSSLISQLMEIERQPIYNKYDQIDKIEEEKKAWQDIDSRISSLESAISDLKFSSTFNSKIVTSTDETKVTATATTSAAITSLTIEDIVLAKPGQITSTDALDLSDGIKAFTIGTEDVSSLVNNRFDENETMGIVAGDFTINEKTISVEEDDTIYLVVNKINAANAGVTASVDENGNFKLEATEASASRKIEIGTEDASGFLTAMGMADIIGTTVENGSSPDYLKTISEVKADNPGSTLDGVQSGFFTINGYTFEVDESVDTLNSLVSKINSADAGVTAFYNNNTKKVTLTADEAGDDIILENDTSGFLTSMNLMNGADDTDADANRSVYEGSNSSVKINGVEFVEESNSFSVNGVNIELKGATEAGEKVDLAVEQDVDKAYDKIKAFIDKYNEVIEKIESYTGEEGIMQGNSQLNNMKFNLRAKLTYTVEGVDSSYNQLAMLGIKVDSNTSSKLSVDNAQLKQAIEENPDAVQELFTLDSGITKITGEVVGTGDGTIVDFELTEVPDDDNIDSMQITVDGKTYTSDGETYKLITAGEPGENEIFVNTLTGDITFGTAPSGEITATYYYENSDANGGIAERLDEYLRPFTVYNGTLDNQISGIDDRVEDMNEWITSYEYRIQMREDSLRAQFTAMEQAMSTSNSQSQWLTSQIAGLS